MATGRNCRWRQILPGKTRPTRQILPPQPAPLPPQTAQLIEKQGNRNLARHLRVRTRAPGMRPELETCMHELLHMS